MRENTSPENMSDPNTRKEFVEALARVIWKDDATWEQILSPDLQRTIYNQQGAPFLTALSNALNTHSGRMDSRSRDAIEGILWRQPWWLTPDMVESGFRLWITSPTETPPSTWNQTQTPAAVTINPSSVTNVTVDTTGTGVVQNIANLETALGWATTVSSTDRAVIETALKDLTNPDRTPRFTDPEIDVLLRELWK
jgi:hypothetical protein